MNIITCIKQVPASSNVEVDPVTGVLIRDGNNVKMNPYDLYALEFAFSLKERVSNANVHSITMGPPSAKEVLYESLYMGGDDATLCTDRKFAGADVLATSYTLSQVIRHIDNYDVIVCGKQTTDGDTAQVGPEIAEFLGIPHIPYVTNIIDVTTTHITLESTQDQMIEVVQVELPCLITVDKGHLVPRLPSYRRKVQMSTYQIPSISLSHLPDSNPDHYGLTGSPTQVEEIFPPDKNTDSIRISGDAKTLANKLKNLLEEHRYW